MNDEILLILATKPGALVPAQSKGKSKDSGFKFSGDGRLIIKDDGSDSDTDKKSKKLHFMAKDSDNESGEKFDNS